jgi:hypothetical protein
MEKNSTVEKIVGKRFSKDGVLQYKIKWQGYDGRYNSWVSAEDLDCLDEIEEYEVWMVINCFLTNI